MKSFALPNNLLPQRLSQTNDTLKGLQQSFQQFSKQIFYLKRGSLKQQESFQMDECPIDENEKNSDQNRQNRNPAIIQGNTQKDDVQQQMYNVLKSWFLDNLENPYPSQKIRSEMVQQTGLTHNQVSIWFNNTRQRYLDPLKKKTTLKDKKYLTKSKRKENLSVEFNQQKEKIRLVVKSESNIAQTDRNIKTELKLEESDKVHKQIICPSTQFGDTSLIKQNMSLSELTPTLNQCQPIQMFYQPMMIFDPYQQQQAQMKAQPSFQDKHSLWMFQQQQWMAQVQYIEYIKNFPHRN